MNIYNPKSGKTENVTADLYETERNIRSMYDQLCDGGLHPIEVAMFMTEAVSSARMERALTKYFAKEGN